MLLGRGLTGRLRRWEFVTSLEFEMEVYTRKRPWRWSLLVYIAARVLALGAIITEFFGFDYPSEFDCSVWYRATLVRPLLDVQHHPSDDPPGLLVHRHSSFLADDSIARVCLCQPDIRSID